MIELLAAIFLVIGGVKDAEPVRILAHGQTFATMEQCEAFKNGEDNKASIDALTQRIKDANPGVDFVIDNYCEAP